MNPYLSNQLRLVGVKSVLGDEEGTGTVRFYDFRQQAQDGRLWHQWSQTPKLFSCSCCSTFDLVSLFCAVLTGGHFACRLLTMEYILITFWAIVLLYTPVSVHPKRLHVKKNAKACYMVNNLRMINLTKHLHFAKALSIVIQKHN